MSVSDKTCSSTSTKPSNVFYVWYSELCRRKSISPSLNLKVPRVKNGTILDFVGDRLKIEEWKPILNALYLDKTLHVVALRSRLSGRTFNFDIDTEDKLRLLKRNVGCLWTDYVMKGITTSLCNCLLKSEVLSTIEIDGLPLYNVYFTHLMEAVRVNKTLKMLSFKRCPIKDIGCDDICNSLRHLPNIEVLILIDCDLTNASATHIGKLIKHQQLNRYCETWNNSLRYADPPVEKIAGLKRITLNNNPLIGNEGLEIILSELADDLWLKAIDMQNCGITESMAGKLLETLHYNRTLEIADFRKNDLSFDTVNKIHEILRDRLGFEAEFQWCATKTTLDPSGSVSNFYPSATNMFHKSQSVPLQNLNPSLKSTANLRATKTSTDLHKPMKANFPKSSQSRNDFFELHKQVSVLSNRLKEEMRKRMEAEKSNKMLRKKLEKIQKFGSSQGKQKVSKKPEKNDEKLKNNSVSVDNDHGKSVKNISRSLNDNQSNVDNLLKDHIIHTAGNQNGYQQKIANEEVITKTNATNHKQFILSPRKELKENASDCASNYSEAPQSILEKYLFTDSGEDNESDDDYIILQEYCDFKEDVRDLSEKTKPTIFLQNDCVTSDQTLTSPLIEQLLDELIDDNKAFSSPTPSPSSGSSSKTVLEQKHCFTKTIKKKSSKVK